MSVNTETASAQGQTTVLEKEGVYASLFEKINLTPASSTGISMRFWMTPRFLTLRRVNARQLPDKAVDLLDTASARIRMSLDTVPEPLTRMKAQLTALAMEKQALLEDIAVGNTTHGERLVAIEQDESRIILQLDEREIQYGQSWR